MLQGVSSVTLNIQVPLAPEAIQISVWGLAARESELRALVKSILTSLNGDSTWRADAPGRLTAEQRGYALAQGAIRLIVFIGLIGAGVFALVKRLKRRAPNSSA